jgi:hypothetical protein
VAQPFDRAARLPAPGKVDRAVGDFWVENPWEIVANGHNLSNYERQRFYLNHGGRAFFDLSYLSGADRDFDGRTVVAGDFRNVGRLDLVVRHAGGGPLVIYENQFPQRHYLLVSLRGQTSGGGKCSNRQGIGARLTAVVGGRRVVRELYPANSYMSQMPNVVHFGLGTDTKVDRLIIRWPSGRVQELTDVAADRHIVIDESRQGTEAIDTVVPGETRAP